MYRASTLTKTNQFGAFLLMVGPKDHWKRPALLGSPIVSTEGGPFGGTSPAFGQLLMGEVVLSARKVDHGVVPAYVVSSHVVVAPPFVSHLLSPVIEQSNSRMDTRFTYTGGRQPLIGIVRRCQAFLFKVQRLLSGFSVVGGPISRGCNWFVRMCDDHDRSVCPLGSASLTLAHRINRRERRCN